MQVPRAGLGTLPSKLRNEARDSCLEAHCPEVHCPRAALVKSHGGERCGNVVWYGSPQWQIEALRRLEIPEDMQKKYGFAPLGDANSAAKQLIFGGNATKFYKIRLKAAYNTKMPAFSEDRLASLKNEYALAANKPRTCATATFAPRKMSNGRGGGAAKLRRRSERAAAGKTISIDKSNFGHRSLSDLGQRICDVPSNPMRRQTQLDGAGWTSARNGLHAI